MIQTLLRPYYLAWNRRFTKAHGYLIIVVITGLLFAGQWAYENFLDGNLAALTSDETITLMLFSGVFAMVFIGLLDLRQIVHRLFRAPDLDILMVNPVPMRSIYLLKLLQCSWSVFVPGLFLMAFLVLAGIERQMAAHFYLLMPLTMLALMVAVASLLVSGVLLIGRVVASDRLESQGTLLMVLLPLLFVAFQQPLLTWLMAQDSIDLSAFNALWPALLLALFMIVIAGLSYGVGYLVFVHTYQNNLTAHQTVTLQVSADSQRVSGGWLTKEWRVIRRDTRQALAFAQPIFYCGILLLPVLQSGGVPEGFAVPGFWFLLILVAFGSVTGSGTFVQTVLNEGRNIDLLRLHPVSALSLLRTKLLAVLIPWLVLWSAGIAITGLIYGLALWQIGMLLAVMVVMMIGAAILSIGLTGWQADFYNEQMPLIPGVMVYAVSALWSAAVVLVTVQWIRRDADHPLRLLLDELNIVISDSLVLLAAGILVSLIILAVIIWQAGARHIRQYEPAID